MHPTLIGDYMKHTTQKLAALLCIIAIGTTACELLELDDVNNSDDVSYTDTGVNNYRSDVDLTDDTSSEYDYERETAITNFGWTKVEALNHHFCRLAMKCPERDPELVRELSRFVTYEACIESGPWSLMIGDSTDELTAVNAGRLQFNPDKIDACLQAIQNASTMCDFDTFYADGMHIGNPCDEVFTALQDDGEPCFNDQECFSGECQRDPDSEVCELSTCADERPRPDLVGPGADCTYDICDTGLFCVAEHNVCKQVTVKDRYESCDPDAGEVCDEDSVCLSSLCKEPPTFGAEGDECDDFVTHCKIGLSCNDKGDDKPSKCAPVGTLGEPCERQQQCQVGFWCDHDLGECAAQSDVDEPCTADEACPFGTYCDDSSDAPLCDYWPIDYDEEFCSLSNKDAQPITPQRQPPDRASHLSNAFANAWRSAFPNGGGPPVITPLPRKSSLKSRKLNNSRTFSASITRP